MVKGRRRNLGDAKDQEAPGGLWCSSKVHVTRDLRTLEVSFGLWYVITSILQGKWTLLKGWSVSQVPEECCSFDLAYWAQAVFLVWSTIFRGTRDCFGLGMACIKILKMGLPSQNLYNVKAVKVSSIEVGKGLETLRAEELLALYGWMPEERESHSSLGVLLILGVILSY